MADFIPELIPRDPEDGPDQPPEVDPDADSGHPGCLPELAKAAVRILDWMGEWGDGRIDTTNGQHLFVRDLFVVARHAQEATR